MLGTANDGKYVFIDSLSDDAREFIGYPEAVGLDLE